MDDTDKLIELLKKVGVETKYAMGKFSKSKKDWERLMYKVLIKSLANYGTELIKKIRENRGK